MATFRIPDGLRVIAFGDIHGHLAALDRLLTRLRENRLEDQRGLHDRYVFLGDYVDRGPDSAGVIDRLIGLGRTGLDCIFLRGNHEALFYRYLVSDDLRMADSWLVNGGQETLASYGVDVPEGQPTPDVLRTCLNQVRDLVPKAHVDFLGSLRPSHREGDYFFTHAGVRPGVALDDQDPEDMMWIRGSFLTSTRNHGAMVVHGHTPERAPDIRDNRIGIDTGAGKGGYLTAAVFWSTERTFLHADPNSLR